MARTRPVLADTAPVGCGPLCEAGPLDEPEAVAVAARLRALGDPVRLRLVALLLAADGREACTCDLAPDVGLSEPTVSHHLRQLLEVGLVSKERRGANVYYRPEAEALRAVGRVLAVGG